MVYLELAVRGRFSVGGDRSTGTCAKRLNLIGAMGDNAMAFQAVPNTAEVTIIFTQHLETFTNTFHVEKVAGYDQTDIDFIAGKVDANVATDLLPIMTADCTYERVEVRGLNTENDLFGTADANAGPGARVAGGLPGNVTLSIKKSSSFTGRSARGRWYFIGAPDDTLGSNENQFAAASVDDMVAGVEDLRAGSIAGDWVPVIVSRYAGGILRDEGETFDWISTVAVNNNVDSQRRRLTG